MEHGRKKGQVQWAEMVRNIRARKEEDKGMSEDRENINSEGDFRRSQRYEGENFNPSFRGGGGNPMFFSNQ
jgi:hypothetical protein